MELMDFVTFHEKKQWWTEKDQKEGEHKIKEKNKNKNKKRISAIKQD